jgi:hypothetical protein
VNLNSADARAYDTRTTVKYVLHGLALDDITRDHLNNAIGALSPGTEWRVINRRSVTISSGVA